MKKVKKIKKVQTKAKAKKKVLKIVKKRKVRNPTIVSDLEKFYKIINKLQTTSEQIKILVSENDSFTYDNILKDLELTVTRKHKNVKNKKYIEYTLNVGRESKAIPQFEDIENLPDEFFEDGQLFGI